MWQLNLGISRNLVSPLCFAKDVAEEDLSYLYGVQVRKVVDNKLKPSNLNYKARELDAPLNLVPEATVAEICKSASAASGLKLMADARIGALPIKTVGQSARAGDILQAMALCLTGAYRKVGDIYLLTSDLEGVGTRRLKLAVWKWDIDTATQRREREWREAIRTRGRAQDIPFQPDGLPLNDAMTKFLEGDRDGRTEKTMPATDLPPQWQQVLKNGQSHLSDDMIMRTDVVEPSESVSWNFVLPDGRDLLPEGRDIGQLNGLLPRSMARSTPAPTSPNKPILFRSGSSTAFVFKTDNPDVAARLPLLAQPHGFEEIWIQTRNERCLVKAIEASEAAHMRVRLVLAPWELPAGSSTKDPDVTILGSTAPQSSALQEGSEWWLDARSRLGFARMETGNSFGPSDPVRAQMWQKLVDLAKTPGLDGSVVYQTEPPGYEPTVSRTLFAPEQLMIIGELGYSQALRSQFVASNSVDPVDFVDNRVRIANLDLSLPMFGDPDVLRYRKREPLEESEALDLQWLQLRSTANRSATTELVNLLPGPVIVQPRDNVQDHPHFRGFSVTPWQAGADLPTSKVGAIQEEADLPPDAYWVVPLGYPLEPAAADQVRQYLTRHIQRYAQSKLAIDMSSVPVGQLAKQLDFWFQKL